MKRVYTCERQKSTDVPYGKSPIIKIRRTEEGNEYSLKCKIVSEKDSSNKKQSTENLETLLGYYHEQLEKRDSHNFFAHPVTDDIAPGYSTIIRRPIDLGSIRHKIKRKTYNTLTEYQSDTRLMCHNAMTYNTPDTIYYQKARKLLAYIEKAMLPSKAEALSNDLGIILSRRQLGYSDDEDEEDEEEEEDQEDDEKEGSETTDGCTDYSPGPPRLSPMVESVPYRGAVDEDTDDEEATTIIEQAKEAAKNARQTLESRYGGEKKIPKLAYLTIGRPVTPGGVFAYECGSVGTSIGRPVLLPSTDEVELFLGSGAVPAWQGEQLWRELEALNTSPREPVAAHLDWVLKGFSEDTARQLVSAYGDSLAVEYAYSLLTFASECGIFPRTLAHKCLNILTEGEHDRVQQLWRRRIPNAIPFVSNASLANKSAPVDSSGTRVTTNANVVPSFPSRQTATVQPFARSGRT